MRDGVSAMFQLAEPSFALLNSGFKSDPVDIETTASMQRKSTVVFICSGKVCCEVDLVPLHLYGYMDFPVYFSARELESLFKKFSWFWYSRGAWNSESIYSQLYCSFYSLDRIFNFFGRKDDSPAENLVRAAISNRTVHECIIEKVLF